MNVFDDAAAFAQSAVWLATPIALAAAGETLAETTGVLYLGLEGSMIAGACAAALASHAADSAAAGLVAGAAAGAGVALLFAFLTLALRAGDVIAGTAMNLLAAGAAAVAWRTAFGLQGVNVRVAQLGPWALPAAAMLILPAAWFYLYRTAPGLRWRAAGEAPHAAEACGIRVRAVRVRSLAVCGALAGAGGAALSIADAGTFSEGMTAGRGFVALALVVFGGHHPLRIGASTLLFGAALAAQYRFQAAGFAVPPELFRSLPYILAIAALMFFAGKRRAPAALGRGLAGGE